MLLGTSSRLESCNLKESNDKRLLPCHVVLHSEIVIQNFHFVHRWCASVIAVDGRNSLGGYRSNRRVKLHKELVYRGVLGKQEHISLIYVSIHLTNSD